MTSKTPSTSVDMGSIISVGRLLDRKGEENLGPYRVLGLF
jgi:hypothetical protein